MATPVYIIGLNSSLIGMAADADLAQDGTPNLSSVMIGTRPLETTIHPLIRGWVAGSGDPLFSNSDPYRKVMNYTYSYIDYMETGLSIELINGFRSTRLSPAGNALVGSDPGGSVTSQTPYFDLDAASPPGMAGLPPMEDRPPFLTQWIPGGEGSLFLEFNNLGWNLIGAEATTMPNGITVAPEYTDFLDQDNASLYNEGYPWFDEFLTGTMGPTLHDWSTRLDDAGQVGTYDGIFKYSQPTAIAVDAAPRWLYDHSFAYKPAMEWDGSSANPGLIGLGELTQSVFEVQANYNYYVDSSPDYETAISASRIPECLLPNYYMLCQTFLEGPAVAATPPTQGWSYLPQSTAGTSNGDLQELFKNNSDLPASVMQGYWEAISPIIHNVTDGEIATHEKLYKNVFISYRDLGIHDLLSATSTSPVGDVPTLDTIPFYNRVRILDQGQISPAAGTPDYSWEVTDFFNNVVTPGWNTGATQTEGDGAAAGYTNWLLGLQMLAANSYNPDLPAPALMTDQTARDQTLNGVVNLDPLGFYNTSLNMDLNFMGPDTPGFIDPNTSPNHASTHVVQPGLPVRADLAYLSLPYNFQGGVDPVDGEPSWDSTAGTGTPMLNATTLAGGTTLSYIHRYKTVGTVAPELNYSIIKEVPTGPGAEHEVPRSDTFIHEKLTERTAPAKGQDPGDGRFQGTPGQTAPLMYVIEKRVVTSPATSADMNEEPVQRIFISRRFPNELATDEWLTYIDTQVKYGVRYQYDVKMLTAIFGLTYQYSNMRTEHNYEEITSYEPRRGRPLGNALGFYDEQERFLTNMGLDLKQPATQLNWAMPGAARTIGPYYEHDASNQVHQTDIGYDQTLAMANISDLTPDYGQATGHAGRQGHPWAHTGYYVFGNSFPPPAASTSEGEPNYDLIGSNLQEGWVMPFAASLRNDWPHLFDGPGHTSSAGLQTLLYEGDPGLATNVIGTSPPGGYYSTSAQEAALSRLIVRVETGIPAPAGGSAIVSHTGIGGNADGGLVPVRADIGSIREIEYPVVVEPCQDIGNNPNLNYDFALLEATFSAFFHWYQTYLYFLPLSNPLGAAAGGAPPFSYYRKKGAGEMIFNQTGWSITDVQVCTPTTSTCAAAPAGMASGPYAVTVRRWYAGKSFWLAALGIPNIGGFVCPVPFPGLWCLPGNLPSPVLGPVVPATLAQAAQFAPTGYSQFGSTYGSDVDWGVQGGSGLYGGAYDPDTVGPAGMSDVFGDCSWYPMHPWGPAQQDHIGFDYGYTTGMPGDAYQQSVPRGEAEIGAIIWWCRHGVSGNTGAGRFSAVGAGGKDLLNADLASSGGKAIFEMFDAAQSWNAGTMLALIDCAIEIGHWQKPALLGGASGAGLAPDSGPVVPGAGEMSGYGSGA